tara:strand:+ start:297 stop:617 length:321 start_codon:yes stop_codon:yes gene_type:complete
MYLSELPENVQNKIYKYIYDGVLKEMCGNFEELKRINEKHALDATMVKQTNVQPRMRTTRLIELRLNIIDNIKHNKPLLKLYANDLLKYKYILPKYMYTDNIKDGY